MNLLDIPVWTLSMNGLAARLWYDVRDCNAYQVCIHLALLNSSIEAGILLCGNGALPRHDGRALSRACVTRLSALSFGCFSYTGSHSLLLLT